MRKAHTPVNLIHTIVDHLYLHTTVNLPCTRTPLHNPQHEPVFHISAYQPLVNVLLNDSADTVREYVTGASAEDKRYIAETLMGILQVC